MKRWSVAAVVAFTLFLFAAPLRAQSEIDPDHFDSPNTEALESTPKSIASEAAPVGYEGTLRLPYAVECSGKRLAPGNYTLWLRTTAKEGRVTLRQSGHTVIVFAGELHAQNRAKGYGTLLVRIRGNTRTLRTIQMAKMEVVVESTLRITESSVQQSERIDRVPVIMARNTN
jgi:hypothetical protein